MVVCNTPVMQFPAACPITPTITPFFPGLISTITRHPPTSIISAPVFSSSSIPCAPGLPSIRCTPPSLSPRTASSPPDSPRDNIATNVISCNGVNFVPCTVSLSNGATSILPLTQGFSSSAFIPFTPNTNTRTVQCTAKMVNGHSVLQCTPGVCPMTSAMMPTTPVEMCSIPSPTFVSNSNNGMVPVNTFNSLTSNLSAASTAISSWKQLYGMEQVWQCEFKSLFSQYNPHVWTLFPVVTKPDGIWNANVDSAKVRFYCDSCGHGWTSMKGRVTFWFYLNPTNGEGFVCLKLYGQQCDRCKSGNYEPAMWYPEEVLKVLVNIYNRVGQVYYGFQQAPYHRARRAGKPRTPHNSDLCQACKDGVCSERR